MRGKEHRKYTEEDYKKVLKLRSKGISFSKISNDVGVSKTTAIFWINTKRKPRILYSKRKEKKLPSKSKELSAVLVYIYGVLVGDGSIESNGRTHRIILNVTDKEFAEKFAANLEAWSDMRPSTSERTVTYNHRTKYGNLIKGRSHMFVVRLNSKQAVNFLLSKLKSKTYDWEVPENILNCNDEEIICNFLKGFFDSEGCVVQSGRCRKIEADSVNEKGLEKIQLILEKIDIESVIVQNEKQTLKGIHTLRISKRKDLEKFASKVNFSINRKRKKLENLLKSYKRYVYQVEETENKILENLRDRPKTVKEISKIINRNIRTTHYHVNNLEKRGKIECIKRWRIIGGNVSNLWLLKAKV